MNPRPPRTSREAIVRAAADLLDAEGVEAFSMRRLGAEMGVDPMTIYYHLPTKAALFDAVVDHLWSSVPLPDNDRGTPWREQVASVASGLRQALLAHPRLVTLVGTRPAVTPYLLRVLDQAVGALGAQGLPADEAMRVLDCVMGYVIGKVQGELQQPQGGADVTTAEALATLTPETHPHLVAAMTSGYDWAPDEEFERGLRAMLEGWPVA